MINQKRKKEIDNFLGSLNIQCHDYERFDTALTHSSYTFEKNLSSLENNERLEFYGDAVLKLIVSDYLLERFPEYSEGELTKIRSILVSDNTLCKIAQNIQIGKVLKLGYHEEKMGGRKRHSTLACAFESILGALYLDGKDHELRMLLIELLADEVTLIDESESKYNFKAILQEYTQAQTKSLPLYKIVKEAGPPHDKTFKIEVIVNEEVAGLGNGKTKKEAQQEAAKNAVQNLSIIEGN